VSTRVLRLMRGAAAVLAWTAAARAEPTDAEKSLAQELFDDARRLMAKGDYAHACPKLAQSQRLDPGGGTMLNLAFCHENEGRVATAWTDFNLALSLAIRDGRKDREQIAKERILALAPRVSHLALSFERDPSPEMRITLDGEELARDTWSTAIPIDPGAHKVEVRQPGKVPWSREIDVVTARDAELQIRGFEDVPKAPSRAANTADEGRGQRTAGWIVGGAGLVALGVGAAFGVATLVNKHDSDRLCSSSPCDNPAALDANDRAHTDAWVADIALGVGVVALAVGVFLVLTAKAPPRAAARPLVLTAKAPARPFVLAVSPGGLSVQF
jgi:hypothetical protein